MISSSARSMRSQAPETTLLNARQLATTAGISEVTDITELDVMGVPVVLSVRPQALADKFTFGKGLRSVDAEVGAYMEALEFFYAEPNNRYVSTYLGTAKDVVGQAEDDAAILDFVPLLGRAVDLNGPMLLSSACDIESGDECFVPAELIHYPASDVGQSIFGSSTNGLASGNSLTEATIQGLLELIERDIWSFELIRNASKLIQVETLPEVVREIIERAESNDLRLIIRSVPNDYGLPFFVAFLADSNNPSRKTFNGGWACDLNRDRALVRAVTEAAQSRVAFIHGGRKLRPSQHTDEQEARLVKQQMIAVSDAQKQMSFLDVPGLTSNGSLEQKLELIVQRLRCVVQKEKPVLRVGFTPKDSPLQVVRVVVPTLENLKENRVRIGPRLKEAIKLGEGICYS